jgi:hypothetical protein
MPDMKEHWLPILGYEGLYSVSDFGNVMSMNYANTGMLKILQPAKNSHGYFQVWLSKDRKQKSFPIHRLVMVAFVGPPAKGYEVNHISGIKTDNRLHNLEYVTSSQNRLHAFRTGIQVPAHGEKHCNAKLSLADVIEIKKKYAEGWKQSELANLYRVGQTSISRIVCGQRWTRALENYSA